MFVGDKEALKDFILNYHNNVDDDYKDVSVNDFFTLNDDVTNIHIKQLMQMNIYL